LRTSGSVHEVETGAKSTYDFRGPAAEGNARSSVVAQQETVRAVNATIRDFAADPRIPEDAEWEFFCECGCFTLVAMTIAEFDQDEGVWAAGHGVPAINTSD
jgi:hypothetical protein